MANKKRVTVYDQTKRISKLTNKHGRIKDKKMSKKERQEVHASCMHHVERNGRLKSRLIDQMDMDGTAVCRLCNATFTMEGPTKDELKKRSKSLVQDIDFMKWLCQSSGSVDQKTVDYFCKLEFMLLRYPKIAGRVQKQYSKLKDAVNKRKGGNKSNNNDYGMWSEKSWR